VYNDSPNESKLIQLLLIYTETPQYLRRRLFKKRDELRYVGILPPLRTPHHPITKRIDLLNLGEFREGVIIEKENGKSIVDIGIDVPLIAEGRSPSTGSRVTIKISSVKPKLKGVLVKRNQINVYWGYQVILPNKRIDALISSGKFDIKIATSRHASFLTNVEDNIIEQIKEANSILIAFGSPKRGLREILGNTYCDVFDFDFNAIPHQGTDTVRTEEAIAASLALLNHIIS
jgi:predicted SPOUT superfamily RNA methylase MTH1